MAETNWAFDIPPSEFEEWADEGRKSLENASRAKPLDTKELQEAYGKAMLELRAKKQLQSLLGENEK